jgi:hypothetical protein
MRTVPVRVQVVNGAAQLRAKQGRDEDRGSPGGRILNEQKEHVRKRRRYPALPSRSSASSKRSFM